MPHLSPHSKVQSHKSVWEEQIKPGSACLCIFMIYIDLVRLTLTSGKKKCLCLAVGTLVDYS